MKPFDLEKALAGHPVVTRDGLPVKNFSDCNGTINTLYPLEGVVQGLYRTWSPTGRWDILRPSALDLFMAEEPRLIRPEFIDEALAVYEETGLTPRQLLDRLNQLTGESK